MGWGMQYYLLSPSDYGLESLSLAVMASDTLTIIDSYYKNYEYIMGPNDDGCKREFCVGRVTMRGMVGKELANYLHGNQREMKMNAWTSSRN